MSRIALVGEGPLPGSDTIETGFAQLRLAQFHAALATRHEVHVLDAHDPDLRAALARLRVDAVVTAGTWAPTRAAVAAVGDEPLCVDLPGDPFADAQAVAAFAEPDATARAAAAVFVPALLRADAFTTISGPSRYALLGQLGVLGRLARTPPGHEWAHVAPIAWSFPGLDEAPPRPPGREIRIALIGSFNTWFDAETLLAGLLLAMDRAAVSVRVIGGAVAGHHTATFDTFAAGARASRHAGRFTFLSRLPARELAGVLAASDLGISLDRAGCEPEFGSRTRVLLYLHQGMRVIATPTCELVRELAAEGFVHAVPRGDAGAVAEAIVATGRTLPDRAPLRSRYAIDETTRGLREWAAAPARVAIHGDADVTAALRRERDALRRELDAVRGSPTWRALDRLRRLVR